MKESIKYNNGFRVVELSILFMKMNFSKTTIKSTTTTHFAMSNTQSHSVKFRKINCHRYKVNVKVNVEYKSKEK